MPETTTKITDYDSDPTQFYTEVKTLDGTVVLVPFIRQSERRAFKTCQYQWDWAWNQGFTPALPKQDARWFGTGLHLCLAEWLVKGKKRGKDMHATWDEFCADNYAKIATGPYFDAAEWVDAKELGHEMIKNYLEHYGQDDEWEVIATEQRYRMKIYAPDPDSPKGKKVVGVLVGTFDAVLRNVRTGQIWMVDHKTARERINTNHLIKDEQAGTYVSIATLVLRAQGKIGPDEVVQGIMYNFLRKAKADTRPRNSRGVYCNKPTKEHYVTQIAQRAIERGVISDDFHPAKLKKMKVDELEALASESKIKVLGEESKTQPAPLFVREFVVRNAHERARQIDRVSEELQQMHAIRGGLLPLTKAPGEHCAWCDFKELCDVDEQGGDVAEYARAAFRKRDPYADHRAGAINSKTSVKADNELKKKARAF